MLKKPLLKSFLIKALIINIIVFFSGITIYARHPAVTFGSSNYLVVWQDYRNSSWDIYGTRVDQSGNVLDTAGIAISPAPGSEYLPTVAFDDTNYLVVWCDISDIYGARVDQSGNVLDTNGIAISTAVNYQMMPSIAFDGTNYLVLWSDKRSGSYDIYGTRVDQSGNVLDTAGVAISIDTNGQAWPSISFDGINYLVVWQDYRNSIQHENADIYGARVDQAGNVLDTAGILISAAPDTQKYPAVAFDDTNYLVVWKDSRNGYSDIYGARVDQSGNVLDTAGIAISTDTNRQRYASVAFDGTNYLVVWEDYRNVYPDIYGTRVDQSGNVLDTAYIRISTAVDSQFSPSVAFDGTNYLIVWQDLRSGIYDVYGARVDPSGIVIDTLGIFISTSSTGIEEEDDINLDCFFLSQNSPNPFIRRTKISFTLPKALKVSLKVYDISGRLVATLVEDWRNAGTHEVKFDGSGFASGVYIYRLQASEFTETKKMVLIR